MEEKTCQSTPLNMNKYTDTWPSISPHVVIMSEA